MSMPKVRAATAEDQSQLVDTLMVAFVADPFARYMGPDASQYHAGRAMFDAMAAASIAAGGAWLGRTAQGLCGSSSLWFPPGTAPPEDAMTAAVLEAVAPDRLETVGQVFAAMTAYHPEEPHWYLALLGADAHFQGQGLGAALLKHTLQICDEAGDVAYLESSNPRNISIYERHGFEVTGEIRIADCPVITPMLRAPR
jgi:ribosomal protein S18 acetylase RimI-like enzyme